MVRCGVVIEIALCRKEPFGCCDKSFKILVTYGCRNGGSLSEKVWVGGGRRVEVGQVEVRGGRRGGRDRHRRLAHRTTSRFSQRRSRGHEPRPLAHRGVRLISSPTLVSDVPPLLRLTSLGRRAGHLRGDAEVGRECERFAELRGLHVVGLEEQLRVRLQHPRSLHPLHTSQTCVMIPK